MTAKRDLIRKAAKAYDKRDKAEVLRLVGVAYARGIGPKDRAGLAKMAAGIFEKAKSKGEARDETRMPFVMGVMWAIESLRENGKEDEAVHKRAD